VRPSDLHLPTCPRPTSNPGGRRPGPAVHPAAACAAHAAPRAGAAQVRIRFCVGCWCTKLGFALAHGFWLENGLRGSRMHLAWLHTNQLLSIHRTRPPTVPCSSSHPPTLSSTRPPSFPPRLCVPGLRLQLGGRRRPARRPPGRGHCARARLRKGALVMLLWCCMLDVV